MVITRSFIVNTDLLSTFFVMLSKCFTTKLSFPKNIRYKIVNIKIKVSDVVIITIKNNYVKFYKIIFCMSNADYYSYFEQTIKTKLYYKFIFAIRAKISFILALK